jgi:hypothetical protein
MSAVQFPKALPQSLYRFFWEVDPAQLDPGKHPQYIINRLLDKGDLAAARWVLQNYPKGIIVQTFRTMRDFSPWNGRFWARYLEILEEEVACLQPSYLQKRRMHWPY